MARRKRVSRKRESALSKLFISIFLASIMVLSIGFYFFSTGPTPVQKENQQEEKITARSFESLPGRLVREPFNSIEDALNLTPPGVTFAQYTNLSGMPFMFEVLTRSQLKQEGLGDEVMKKLYNATATRVYFASVNKTPFLLATIQPRIVDFGYVELPYRKNGYPLLLRDDNNFLDVMGDPLIHSPRRNTLKALDIIAGKENMTAYQEFQDLLAYTGPAEFQLIDTNTSFATRFYMGIAARNQSYERLTIYEDINTTLLPKLQAFQANSTQRGLTEYNITTQGNFTIVRIASQNIDNIFREEYT